MHEVAPAQTTAATDSTAVGWHVTKLEAAGNDFLVRVEPRGAGALELSADAVRRLCDRRRGVGADGVILGRLLDAGEDPDGAVVSMTLYNADGTRAEMSGNGIRCLVHAALGTGLVRPGAIRVRTDAGVRVVDHPGTRAGARCRVDMGPVRLGATLESPLEGSCARRADVGNPHVVVVGPALDLSSVDLGALARRVARALGAEVNVEVVTETEAGVLSMRVFERGVGETAACGTGSCAAAAVARAAHMAGDHVVVVNPGGPLEVDLGAAEDDPVFLGGPVSTVAEIVVDPALVGEEARTR